MTLQPCWYGWGGSCIPGPCIPCPAPPPRPRLPLPERLPNTGGALPPMSPGRQVQLHHGVWRTACRDGLGKASASNLPPSPLPFHLESCPARPQRRCPGPPHPVAQQARGQASARRACWRQASQGGSTTPEKGMQPLTSCKWNSRWRCTGYADEYMRKSICTNSQLQWEMLLSTRCPTAPTADQPKRKGTVCGTPPAVHPRRRHCLRRHHHHRLHPPPLRLRPRRRPHTHAPRPPPRPRPAPAPAASWPAAGDGWGLG